MPIEDKADVELSGRETAGGSLDGLKRELSLARALVTRSVTRTKNVIEQGPGEKAVANAKEAANLLSEQEKRLAKATQRVVDSKLFSDDVQEAEAAKAMDYELRIADAKFDIGAFIRSLEPGTSDSAGSRRESDSVQHDCVIERESRLHSTLEHRTSGPRSSWKDILERIPKFDGDPTRFRKWKNAFVLHVDSSAMDSLEKFELMLKTLSGRAARCLGGRDVTAENYEDARNSLYDFTI